MVVVVLRDEERLVDDPHWDVKARMEAGADDLLLAEASRARPRTSCARPGSVGGSPRSGARRDAPRASSCSSGPPRSGRRRRRASPRGGRTRAARGRAGALRSAAASISRLLGRVRSFARDVRQAILEPRRRAPQALDDVRHHPRLEVEPERAREPWLARDRSRLAHAGIVPRPSHAMAVSVARGLVCTLTVPRRRSPAPRVTRPT